MKNITRRDIKIFFLGIFAAFLFSAIYDWEDSLEAIKTGIREGKEANPLHSE